jgi:phosphate transport system ATP-binding protein
MVDRVTEEERRQEATGPEGDNPGAAGYAPPAAEIHTTVRHRDAAERALPKETVFALRDVTVSYGNKPAVADVTMDVYRHHITAIIGPSGCGKSTLIRAFNRMNDLIPSASVSGEVLYHGVDLYGPQVDPVEVRKRIGMVFQKPNPFPKSIKENVAFGPKILGMDDIDDRIKLALQRAALWDEVKDRLDENAYGMSGGQQQRLCIARCLAVDPDTILMDEPCSALDPISTGRIEDLMLELKEKFSIVIVTHNMQQAARVSDRTAFLIVELDEEEARQGRLVEYDETEKMFTNPSDKRTEDYVSGKVG